MGTLTYVTLLVPLMNEKLSPNLRLRLTSNFENEVWIFGNKLEMLKLEDETEQGTFFSNSYKLEY